MSVYYNLLTRMLSLIWHHIFVFFKTIRCIPPIFVWVVVLFFCYDVNRIPLPLVSTYISTIIYLFFITAWFSHLFLSGFNQTAEYISILKINSRKLYFVSKALFLFVADMGFAMLGALYPVFLEIIFKIKGIAIFEHGVNLKSVICAFILYTVLGFLGSSVSLLFQPNLTKRRDLFSMFMVFCFILLSVTKNQFFDEPGISKYIFYVFPPVIEVGKLFGEKNVFDLNDLGVAILYCLFYSTVTVSIGYWIHSKKLYGSIIARYRKIKK